jgi:hypothetical protein
MIFGVVVAIFQLIGLAGAVLAMGAAAMLLVVLKGGAE